MKVEYFDGTQTAILGQYYYDGDGKRIKRVESSQTTIYIYLGWNIIFEKEMSTNTITDHVFGPNGHVAKIVGGTKYYYHSDHLGSLKQETDEQGNTVWSAPAQYEPFGELRSGGAGNEDGYFYTGKLRDTSTGLYYYGARYYDTKVGRFITIDLLPGDKTNSQSQNYYSYALNNPLTNIDPTGQKTVSQVRYYENGTREIVYSDGTTDIISGNNDPNPYDPKTQPAEYEAWKAGYYYAGFANANPLDDPYGNFGATSGQSLKPEQKQAAWDYAYARAKAAGASDADAELFAKCFVEGFEKGNIDLGTRDTSLPFSPNAYNLPYVGGSLALKPSMGIDAAIEQMVGVFMEKLLCMAICSLTGSFVEICMAGCVVVCNFLKLKRGSGIII